MMFPNTNSTTKTEDLSLRYTDAGVIIRTAGTVNSFSNIIVALLENRDTGKLKINVPTPGRRGYQDYQMQ